MSSNEPRSVRNADRGDALACAQHEKDRGLWNYLVWSFFLAQVLGNDGFLGRPAQAGDDTEDAGADHGHGADSAALAALTSVPGVDQAETSVPTPAVNTVLDGESPVEHLIDGANGAAAAECAGEAIYIHTAGSGDVDALVSGAGNASQPSDDPGTDPSGHNGGIDLGIGIGLDPGTDPSGNTGGIDLGVGIGLDPGIDLGSLVDNLTGSLSGVVDTVFDTVDGVTAPVFGLADALIDTIEVIADGLLLTVQSLSDHLFQTLDATLGSTPLPTIASGLTTTLGNTVEQLSGLDDTVNTTLSQILDLTHDTTGGILASAGSFAGNLADGASAILPDDLFIGGRYTDYNLSLREQVSEQLPSGAPDLLPIANISSLIDHLVGPADSTHDADDQPEHFNVGLPSAIDEIIVRGGELAA